MFRILGTKLHLLIFLQILVMEFSVIASGSMLISIQGFYDSMMDVRGPNAVVITSVSLAPFTSIVSVDLIRERLRGIDDIEIEERIYAVISIGNSSLVLTGLSNESLRRVVSGDRCRLCTGCIYVGEDIAQKLGISPGMEIVAYSPYTSLPYILHICGFARGWPYSWMFVSDLETARSVRGMEEHQASIIIIRSNKSMEKILGAIGLSPSLRSISERAILAIRNYGGNISAKLYSAYGGEALDRIGIPEEIFYAIVIAICIALALSALTLGGFIARSRAREIAVLRISGASSRDIKISLITITLIYTLISSMLSYLLLPITPLRITLLGLPISPIPSHTTIAIGVLLIWIFTSISIMREEIAG